MKGDFRGTHGGGLRGGGAKPNPNRWTDARKKLVAEMWAAGESATIIADRLSRERGFDELQFSRNAVLSLIHRGKVGEVAPRVTKKAKPRYSDGVARPHRSRVLNHKLPGPRRSQPQRVRRPSLPRPPRQPTIKPVPANARPLMSLPDTGCTWPVNSPRQGWHEPFLFCANPREKILVAPGIWKMTSYCPYHNDLAYQPKKA